MSYKTGIPGMPGVKSDGHGGLIVEGGVKDANGNSIGGTSLPGVTSPGDGQLAAPGGITAGAGGQFSQFTGALAIVSTPTDYSNGNAPLSVEQDGTLDSGDGSMQPSQVSRYVNRNGRTTGNPVFQVFADDASGGAHPVPTTEPVFRSTSALNKHVTTYADGSLSADGDATVHGGLSLAASGVTVNKTTGALAGQTASFAGGVGVYGSPAPLSPVSLTSSRADVQAQIDDIVAALSTIGYIADNRTA